MDTGARATLDNPLLRSRMRRDFSRANYIHRPVASDISARPRFRQPQTSGHRTIKLNKASALTPQNTSVTSYNLTKPSVQAAPTHKPHSLPKERFKLNKKPKVLRQMNKFQVGLLALAVLMLGIGGYLVLQGIKTNHTAQVQAARLTAAANKAAKNTNSSGGAPALSTVKPSASTLANYVVAPNLPR